MLAGRALQLAALMSVAQEKAYAQDTNAGPVKERKLTKAEKKQAKRARHG